VTEISAREKRAAQAWMVKMLDDPVRHRRAFNDWAAGAPGRLEYYEHLLGNVQKAGRAARHIRATDLPRRRRARWRPLWPAMAAVTGLAVLGLLLWQTRLFERHGENPVDVAGNLVTQVGEVRRETLSDGSKIILDTNSEVVADVSAEQRRVELKHGRARFIVAHDMARPFVVSAAGNQVIATGTIFDVTLRGGFSVHPIEGNVQVRLASYVKPGSSSVVRLHPGQLLALVDGQSRPPSVMPARLSDAQWVDGVKSFDDVPIKDVIAEVNSYSATQIVLADPSWGDRVIFGDINIQDVEAAAQAIAVYLKLGIDRSQSGKLVLTTK
jgi:transmembrane sensor